MIIYVEGIPASGKTTTINSLSKRFPKQVFKVPQYINDKEGANAEMKIEQSYFMRNDENKWQMAKDSGKKFVFVDRGHLSTIIYNLAKFTIKKNIEMLKVLNWYFEDILSRGKLPDYYVFLKTDPKLSLERRKNLLTTENAWDHQKLLEFANNYYPKLMRNYESIVPLLTIPTDSLSLYEIEQKFVSHFGL